MTAMLQAFVRKVDGTGSVERLERDDAHGRAVMDKWTFARLEERGVAHVEVERVTRYAGGKKGGAR